MGGRSRMGRERADVADVDQAREQVERIQKTCAPLSALARRTFDAECQQAGGSSREVLLHQRVVWMLFEPDVIHPGDLGMLLEKSCDLERVIADAIHAQRQC